MPAKPAAKKFHVMEFVHHDEAAAFVAALSRFLNSPDAPRGGKKKSPIEVWARSPVASEGVVLFLSDAAQAAADKAFSPAPAGKRVPFSKKSISSLAKRSQPDKAKPIPLAICLRPSPCDSDVECRADVEKLESRTSSEVTERIPEEVS